MLGFAAKRIRGGELVIVAASKDVHYALVAYRRRWSIECLFGDTKTRGLNLEDTRLAQQARACIFDRLTEQKAYQLCA